VQGKKKQAVIHVGMQKTGTSSVQVMLASSAKALRSNGYFYPDLPQKEGRVWNSPFRHNIVAATYADFPSTFEKFSADQEEEFWQMLRDDDAIPILSAEEFSRQRDFSTIAKRLQGFDVSIVVYLRRQDKFAEALYNQRNKLLVHFGDPRIFNPETTTEQGLFNFLKDENYIPLLNYKRLLSTIEEQIKPVRIIARDFDREKLKNGDVCHDILAALDIPPEGFSFPQTDANESISNILIQTLINAAETKGLEAARLEMTALSEKLNKEGLATGTYQLFSGGTRSHFLSQYKEINMYIREKYGVSFTGYDCS